MAGVDLNEVHSLTEFQRNAKEHINRINTIDQLEAIAAIENGLEESRQDNGVPAREFLEKMRKKHKISAKP